MPSVGLASGCGLARFGLQAGGVPWGGMREFLLASVCGYTLGCNSGPAAQGTQSEDAAVLLRSGQVVGATTAPSASTVQECSQRRVFDPFGNQKRTHSQLVDSI